MLSDYDIDSEAGLSIWFNFFYLPRALLRLEASQNRAPECLIQLVGSFWVLGRCLSWALSPTQDPKPAGNAELLKSIYVNHLIEGERVLKGMHI